MFYLVVIPSKRIHFVPIKIDLKKFINRTTLARFRFFCAFFFKSCLAFSLLPGRCGVTGQTGEGFNGKWLA
jgi:uncharacterized protein (DUF486 family)